MIAQMPEVCPFCGANHNQFVTGEEAERNYKVTPHRVNDYVIQLLSVPRLGVEHAAYCIKTDDSEVWVDCPSALNRDLSPVQAIYFTHHHFMGACNQYREIWGAKIHLHTLEADLPLARQFPVDEHFDSEFKAYGIQAFHIGGHTPGFTMYVYKSVLFICDYAFPPGPQMRLNPYGPKDKTLACASKVVDLLAERPIEKVCGYNYVAEFDSWYHDFVRVVRQSI
jgi:glyoxylase-like metal-dependent hydrolase (beta-lactamase superfamily II)